MRRQVNESWRWRRGVVAMALVGVADADAARRVDRRLFIVILFDN